MRWRQRTHSQHVCVDVRGIQQTGDWLNKDKESDDHQEQAIDESGEYFNTTVPGEGGGGEQNLKKTASCLFQNVIFWFQQQQILSCCLEALPIGEDPGSFPTGHEGSEQAQDQSRAVEQHVEPVWDQSQAVGPNTIKQLHEGESLKHAEQRT